MDMIREDIKPQVKERPRLGRRRKAFTPERTLAFERAVREEWEKTGIFYGDAPVGMEIFLEQDCFYIDVYELEVPVRPVGIVGDIDNYTKSICDGLQPVAFNDDKQVEELIVRFRGEPRVGRYSKR
jgi:Holliday junction resolvase RusA-like endonuclease